MVKMTSFFYDLSHRFLYNSEVKPSSFSYHVNDQLPYETLSVESSTSVATYTFIFFSAKEFEDFFKNSIIHFVTGMRLEFYFGHANDCWAIRSYKM